MGETVGGSIVGFEKTWRRSKARFVLQVELKTRSATVKRRKLAVAIIVVEIIVAMAVPAIAAFDY